MTAHRDAGFVITRRWMPSEYLDEVVPDARDTPSAWIERLNDGAHVLAAPFPDGAQQHGRRLSDGDEIEFSWTEDHGIGAVRFENEQGRLVLGRWPNAVEGEMFVCALGVPSSVSASIEEFCEHWIDNGEPVDEDVTVAFYVWSGTPKVFKFCAATARFEPVPDHALQH